MQSLRQHTSAGSFVSVTSEPEKAGRAASELVHRLGSPSPSVLVLFASGEVAGRVQQTCRALRSTLPASVSAVIATGSGVFTERGGHEGVGALAGIGWSRAAGSFFRIEATIAADALGPTLAREVEKLTRPDEPATLLLFVRPAGFLPRSLEALSLSRPLLTIFGGGTLPDGPALVAPGSSDEPCAAVGLVLRASSGRFVVRSADACRALHPPMRITEARGSMVLRLDGEPALDVLTASARSLEGQPLVLAMVGAADAGPFGGGADAMIVRPVRGVDPVRRGVVVGETALGNLRLCFAACDTGTARSKLEAAGRDIGRELAGGAPRFGILVSCAGRGTGLYGAPNGDARIVQARFPSLPFAGMLSTFEMATIGSKPTQLWYNAVLGVASAPS